MCVKRIGKKPTITLLEAHLPDHNHVFHDIYYAESESWRPKDQTTRIEIPNSKGLAAKMDTDNVGWAMQRNTGKVNYQFRKEEEHTNFPPYVPLFFCKRT